MSEDGDVYNIWKQMLNAEFKLDKIIELEKGFDIMAKDHQQVVIDITDLEKKIHRVKEGNDNFMKNYRNAVSPFIKRIEKLESQKDVTNEQLEVITEELSELKEQVSALHMRGDAHYRHTHELVKWNRNIEEVLRELKLKVELVGSYVLTTEQFNYTFNDKYWENKKRFGKAMPYANGQDKLGGDKSVSAGLDVKPGHDGHDASRTPSTESQPPSYVQRVKDYYNKNPSEQDLAGSARQTDIENADPAIYARNRMIEVEEKPTEECICPNCKQKCWEWEKLILVEKADLEWLFNTFMNDKMYRSETHRIYKQLKEKYMPEDKDDKG